VAPFPGDVVIAGPLLGEAEFFNAPLWARPPLHVSLSVLAQSGDPVPGSSSSPPPRERRALQRGAPAHAVEVVEGPPRPVDRHVVVVSPTAAGWEGGRMVDRLRGAMPPVRPPSASLSPSPRRPGRACPGPPMVVRHAAPKWWRLRRVSGRPTPLLAQGVELGVAARDRCGIGADGHIQGTPRSMWDRGSGRGKGEFHHPGLSEVDPWGHLSVSPDLAFGRASSSNGHRAVLDG